ncbi:MAG: PQQ-dependent sugar dehydrogenase [Gammaproteobacteria bacterium]|nr:PQQ-dependent sugar dehydrogenase [Gammaproteobacteria bacterium]
MSSYKRGFFIILFLLAKPSAAVEFEIDEVAQLPGIPWGMDFYDDSTLIVTIRSGSAYLLDLDHNQTSRLSGLPDIAADGQGGLLDVAIDPKYHSQGWIYFTYSKPAASGNVTTLARAKISNTSLIEWQDLLVADSASATGRHFGSRIAFDGQGHVFFSIGDRGVRENAQNLNNHAGCILRLTLDGKIPFDNPFVNQKNKKDEIWSYGHRNPQGLIFDQKSQKLWSIEHGPRGGDEINLIKKGLNYGWPIVSHGKEYWGPVSVGEGTEKPGMEPPKKVYIPSIAPGSLMLYTGEAFPEWQNSLFAGALKLRHINHVPILENNQLDKEERLLENSNERIRALRQGPQGRIYFSTDSGKIMRLSPLNQY